MYYNPYLNGSDDFILKSASANELTNKIIYSIGKKLMENIH